MIPGGMGGGWEVAEILDRIREISIEILFVVKYFHEMNLCM